MSVAKGRDGEGEGWRQMYQIHRQLWMWMVGRRGWRGPGFSEWSDINGNGSVDATTQAQPPPPVRLGVQSLATKPHGRPCSPSRSSYTLDSPNPNHIHCHPAPMSTHPSTALGAKDGRRSVGPLFASTAGACCIKKATDVLPFYLINPDCREDPAWNRAVLQALDFCASWAPSG
ncbi:hypothetical protein BC829DRAFT_259411 [Chytridium lagenaria]|nr:hypothetical protein BC829DRAFT_259411 [Chytridium lagenaria]